MPDAPDNRRPDGVDDATVEAAGVVSEAMEYVQRMRGAIYEFHQLVGRADQLFTKGAEQLRAAGHDELATMLEGEIVGRDVLPGRWTFQIVEEFDELYYAPVVEAEQRIREELLGGKRHVLESEMKERRRTAGGLGEG
jgi:hypothetical protein